MRIGDKGLSVDIGNCTYLFIIRETVERIQHHGSSMSSFLLGEKEGLEAFSAGLFDKVDLRLFHMKYHPRLEERESELVVIGCEELPDMPEAESFIKDLIVRQASVALQDLGVRRRE